MYRGKAASHKIKYFKNLKGQKAVKKAPLSQQTLTMPDIHSKNNSSVSRKGISLVYGLYRFNFSDDLSFCL